MLISESEYRSWIEDRERLEVKRKEIQKEVEAARSEGDLKENAAYDIAIDSLRQVQKELEDLHIKIREGTIIKGGSHAHISVGDTIELCAEGMDTRKLVLSSTGSPTFDGKLGVDSELGAAILGSLGGEFDVRTEFGVYHYTVKKL